MGSEGQWDHQQVWSPGRFLASPKGRLGLGRAIILASDVVLYPVCLGMETGIGNTGRWVGWWPYQPTHSSTESWSGQARKGQDQRLGWAGEGRSQNSAQVRAEAVSVYLSVWKGCVVMRRPAGQIRSSPDCWARLHTSFESRETGYSGCISFLAQP